MTSIEVIVSNLQPALHDRAVTLLALELDHGASAHERLCVDQLRAALERSAVLSRTLYTTLPLSAHPDGVGASADDLRYTLMDIKIDEGFGAEEAATAASQIRALNEELEGFLRPVLQPSEPAWVAAAKAIPAPATKGQAEAAIAAKGFSGPLLEALLKADGSRRHDLRVLFLKKAVPAAVKAALEEAGISSNEFGIAGLVMHADAAGVGGHADIEGLGTARPALLSLLCGSGRKQAGDGPAWSSAVSSAAYQEVPNYVAGNHVLYRPDTGELVEYNSFEAEVRVAYRCPAAVAEQLIGPRYLRAAALRAASGPVMTDRQPEAAMLSAAFEWADQAQKEQRARAEARQALGW